MEAEKKKEIKLDGSQLWSILGYASVIMIVGFPMWWKSTEVYRVNLPYDQIEDLSSVSLKMEVPVQLISRDVEFEHELGPKIQAGLAESDIYRFLFSARTPTENEINLINSKSGNLEELDESLRIASCSPGTILLVEIPGANSEIVLGKYRTVYFTKAAASKLVAAAVREVICGEEIISRLILSITQPQNYDETNLHRVTASTSGYDLLFTLLVPEPEVKMVKWEIDAAIRDYVQPFLDSLRNFSSFHVKSQVVYLTKLNLNPKKGTDGKKFVTQTDLGLAINPVESQLASHVSSGPSLNFLVYIPTLEQSPLIIENASGSANSFLIPKWGGVTIYNADDENIDMKRVMGIFIGQLKLLLGLHDSDANRYRCLGPGRESIRLWERDFLFRLRATENLVLTKVTLQSLADLLSKISNIVITDEIGSEVQNAVDNFIKGSKFLNEGQLIPGFGTSTKAFMASEVAFFDPSLLALLYFPEDQKYAIYIPLFLPVGIPVVMSFFTLFKLWRQKFKLKSD